jgi:transcription initiation factor IIE alpha subunit
MHAIEYFTFEENTSKKEMYAECKAHADRNCDNPHGDSNLKPINFIDRVYPCYEDAMAAVEKIDKNTFYGCFAVKYHESPETIPKAIITIRARRDAALKKYAEFENKAHFADAKSQYVGCKCCGSKLSVSFLLKKGRPNLCPMCGEDLRPTSTLERLAKLRQNYKQLNEQTRQAELDFKRKNITGKINWLVKFEYHC